MVQIVTTILTRRRLDSIAGALPFVAALVAVGAYAGLLPAGRWQADEYLGAYFIGHGDWAIQLGSLRWAPRPLAQPLAWLYAAVSDSVGRPMVVEFLGFLWAAAVAGVASAGWSAGVRRPVRLAVLLLALTLLLIKPGEMFYWPVGAAAYLPCWAGLAGATLIHRQSSGQHGMALGLCLLAAALSLEMGAATVVIYGGLAGLVALWQRQRRALVALSLPFACAVCVCVAVLLGRMQPMNEVMDPASGLAGHWYASLRAAIPTFAAEAAGVPGLPLAVGLVCKLLLVLCLPMREPGPGADMGKTVTWAAALVLSAFASVVLAYHQFGALCCERHATLRQGMLLLALASCAGLLGGQWRVVRHIGLAVVIVALLGLRAPALHADWRTLPVVIQARQRSWDSGRGAGDAMTLWTAPPGQITNGDAIPYGSFHRMTDTPWGGTEWYAWGIMMLFHKHVLTVAPMEISAAQRHAGG